MDLRGPGVEVMLPWIIWAVLLVAQNASFTWVSRVRNSPDVRAHALAAVFSNGVFFANLYCAVDQIHTATGFWQRAGVIAFYTLWTVAGSVAAHWYMLKQKR
jgi:hypothetical protein